MKYKVKTEHGQTLSDIALQEYGSADMAFGLALDNNLSSLTQTLQAGTEVVIYSEKIANQQVVSYYKNRGIRVNTDNNAIPTPKKRDFSEVDFEGRDFE